MKKLYIQTYGCQMNQYDSERIAHAMARIDYTLTDQPAAADLILLNTCSVRDAAEQKAIGKAGYLQQRKKKQHEQQASVQVEQSGEPNIRYEREEPRVQVNQAEGEPRARHQVSGISTASTPKLPVSSSSRTPELKTSSRGSNARWRSETTLGSGRRFATRVTSRRRI